MPPVGIESTISVFEQSKRVPPDHCDQHRTALTYMYYDCGYLRADAAQNGR
jgi:hypothetical protein